ncbi:hypothetical protein [Salinicola endophyticus]|uniref:DUF3149 domain-containing protein n=1 Tax=Salinicola endophyticus TaxID=1949083 RepID=A0AB74U882_9GAMM
MNDDLLRFAAVMAPFLILSVGGLGYAWLVLKDLQKRQKHRHH